MNKGTTDTCNCSQVLYIHLYNMHELLALLQLLYPCISLRRYQNTRFLCEHECPILILKLKEQNKMQGASCELAIFVRVKDASCLTNPALPLFSVQH